MTPSDQDLYAILQVHPSAHPDVVAAAYRRLAQLYHPDKNESPDATETMTRINLAYKVLSDPTERAAYDRNRQNDNRRPGSKRESAESGTRESNTQTGRGRPNGGAHADREAWTRKWDWVQEPRRARTDTQYTYHSASADTRPKAHSAHARMEGFSGWVWRNWLKLGCLGIFLVIVITEPILVVGLIILAIVLWARRKR